MRPSELTQEISSRPAYRRIGLESIGLGSFLVLLLATATLAQPAPQPKELTAPAAPVQPIAPTTTAFNDLKDFSYAEAAIARLVSQGIMQGVSATQFAPGMANTRGDFAVSVQHMFNLPQPAQSVEFPDVPGNSPVHAAVEAVAPFTGGNILCFGCALGKNFLPTHPVSRAEATVTLLRILIDKRKLGLVDSTEADSLLAAISDAQILPPPSRVYFATAIKAGVIQVLPGNRIGAAVPLSRADVAVLLDDVQGKFEIPPTRREP